MKKNEHTNSTDALLEYAENSYARNEFVETIGYLEDLEKSPIYKSDIVLQMKNSNFRGMIFFKQGDFKMAEEHFLRSLILSEQTGEARYIYNRYDNLAALYLTTKRFRYAIDCLQKAIQLKESAGNQKDLARGYIQLSGLFFTIENFEAGKEALKSAHSLIRKFDQRELLMHYHFSMGMQHKRESKYKAAIGEYTKSIKFGTEFNDPFVTARAYSNQGDILMQLKRWGESEKKYLASLRLAKDHKMLMDELSASIQLANLALEKKDLAWCRTLFDYVNRKLPGLENDMLQKELAELSARLNKAEGNYIDAIRSYEQYIDYYKKFYDNELSRTVLDIQAKYENEKKESELQKVKLRQVESELKTLRAEQALAVSETRFRALIENGTDIIYIISEKLRPVYASPAAYHILGYRENDKMPVDMQELLHPDDLPVIREKIKLAMKRPGIPIHGQIRLPKKNGGFIWVEGTATNLFHIEGARGIVCNLKDITERKQAESAIKELNESLERKIGERTAELQEANKGLESFSYSISHDLRTPLRSINGYSALLAKNYGDQLDSEAQEFIKVIKDNAIHMGHLIDDLLRLSRLGRQELDKISVDMNETVKSAVSELINEKSPGKIIITVQNLSPAMADAGLIRQVWLNIISNAIKYSKKRRHPHIEVGALERHGLTTYYVQDNGAGFDMAYSDKLFLPFQRLHNKNEFEGIGVGLAIVHSIITKHGGRIWAQSKVNKGTTFFFTLGNNK